MKKDLKFYLKLFTSTFTLSAFTFGGGYVIIPMMRRKFVEQYRWLDEDCLLYTSGSLFVGGVGSYIGSIAGSLVMIVLSNGLTVLDFSAPVRNIVLGCVMVILLTFYNRAKPIRQ